MSHEIRTPMNGVLGMAELLAQSGLNQQQTYYVDTLKRSGRALMDILNDVLDYSKVEAGRMELESIDVDLLELLDDCVTLHRDALTRKGLRCHVLLQPDVPEWVKTDPTRLKQILGNLLSNAIKFSDDGEIHVGVSARQPARLTFTVRDEGSGIPPSALTTLFERFEQADSSISRKHGGTGLGLAICRRLVELMGGRITAENNGDQGATFTFTIEYQAAEHTTDVHEPTACWLLSTDDTLARSIELLGDRWNASITRLKSSGDPRIDDLTTSDRLLVDEDLHPATQAQLVRLSAQSLTLAMLRGAIAGDPAPVEVTTEDADKPLADVDVLVAEDNATNRLVVGKMLDGWGANVRFAEDGAEARDLYAACRDEIDLVLMDCEMPTLDGYAATEAIRALEADGDSPPVPIIAITAHVMPEFRQRAQSVGMSDYVTKPLDRAALLAAIMGATRSHRRPDPRSP